MKSCKILVSIVLVALFWAVIMFPSPAVAIDFRYIPYPHTNGASWVADLAELLSSETEQQLNQLISKLETQNGSEILVVTVPDTQPSETPKQFAISLFNHWGIGKFGKDNGVLFLISRDDRRLEIETGYGFDSIRPVRKLERSIVPDQALVVSMFPKKSILTIIDDRILPRFKQGDFDGGTLAGTRSLAIALGYHEGVTTSQTSSGIRPGPLVATILVGSIVLAAIWGGGSWGGGSSGGGGDGGGW